MLKALLLSLLFLLAGCELEIDRLVIRELVIVEQSTAAPETPTVVPSVTAVTPTIVPTQPPSATAPAPTSVPTIDPTPTQEVRAQIELLFSANIRSAPNGAVVRVGQVNETFVANARNGDWIDIGEGWLFNGSWVQFTLGDFQSLPEVQARDGSPIGYNTLEVYDEQYYIAHARAICPRYMLVMDNLGLADRVHNALNASCGTRVIHRSFSGFEGEEFLNRTAEDMVAQWQREGYPHLIRYSTNEPSCGGNTPCSVLVAHEVRLARLAREAGYTVALGNLGVGKFSPSDVTNGVYNPLIQAVVDYDHLFSPHEYTFGCLCFGFGTMPREALLDASLMQPSVWTGDVPFAFAVPSAGAGGGSIPYGQEKLNEFYAEQAFAQAIAQAGCGALPPYWHLARSFWILLWAECTLGIDASTIEVVHTEWGWDNLQDLAFEIDTLKQSFAHPQYENNLRGWRSLEFMWSSYFPYWSTAEAAWEQMRWAVELYPDNHSFLLFAWSDDRNRDWTSAGFSFGNYGDAPTLELHDLIEEYYRAA